MQTRDRLGEVLRELRAARGLSLRDAGAAADLSPSFVRLVELGQSGVSADRLARLGAVYGLGAADLISLSASEPPGPAAGGDAAHAAVDVLAARGLGSVRALLESDPALLADAYELAARLTLGEVQRAWRDADGAWAQLEALVTVLAPIDDGADLVVVLWLQLLVQGMDDPALATVQRDVYRRTVELYRTVVERGQRDATMRPDVDAATVAWQLAGLVDGLALQVVAGSPDLDGAGVRRLALELARARLRP